MIYNGLALQEAERTVERVRADIAQYDGTIRRAEIFGDWGKAERNRRLCETYADSAMISALRQECKAYGLSGN